MLNTAGPTVVFLTSRFPIFQVDFPKIVFHNINLVLTITIYEYNKKRISLIGQAVSEPTRHKDFYFAFIYIDRIYTFILIINN